MADLDKRFALLRGGERWYAAMIDERGGAGPSFRISQRGVSRDARGQAERVTDILTVARRVILEGRRMRCAKEGEPASSLDLKSSGVSGYVLDEGIARELDIPPSAP